MLSELQLYHGYGKWLREEIQGKEDSLELRQSQYVEPIARELRLKKTSKFLPEQVYGWV